MSRNSAEKRRIKEKRAISATIGYCFVTVLVVLLVMSSYLSSIYIDVLETERADAMKSMAVACATTLNYTDIHEGMQFPLPKYEYDDNKQYIFDIYTRAGNSYIRLYSSAEDSANDYTLSGAGDDYNTCFEKQTICLTKRVDNKVSYVCALAPIISSDNTVSGILEIRMPASDFQSTVNGMSLSWIFTIISIAVSMGIIIFEINLLVSSLTNGFKGNVPQLFAYGEDAVRFLSFFMAFSAIMQPMMMADYIKDQLSDWSSLGDMSSIIIQLLILISLLLYVAGFFGFKEIKKSIKFKITSRVSLIVIPVLSYMLSLVSGIINNVFVTIIFILPVSFASGIVYDYLRDYRINASALKYEDYNDSKIHSLQNTAHMLGIAVGTVVAGVCYERFGMLVVALISGACLILTSLGLIFFFKNNNPRNEQYISLGMHLEMLGNHYLGGLLLSVYLVLGIIFAFLIGFVPNYLETVGITLATTSFYYLIVAFIACFVAVIIRNSFANIMSTKVKVTFASCSTVVGMLLFALMPTAKVLVITVMLLGLALGMNDFTYLFALAFLANKAGLNISVRRLAEKTFALGTCIGLFFNAVALSINKITIIFIIGLILLLIVSFMYPVSSVAGLVDSVQKKTVPVAKKKPKNSKKVTNSRAKNMNVDSSSVNSNQPSTNEVSYGNPQAYSQTPYPDDYNAPQETYSPDMNVPNSDAPQFNDYGAPVADMNYNNNVNYQQEAQLDGNNPYPDSNYNSNNETSFLNDNPYGGDV